MSVTYAELGNLALPWEKLKGANILITGGNGMIASSLADALMELNGELSLGLHLYVLCRNQQKAEARFKAYEDSPAFTLVIQDVSQKMSVDIDFQYIIHAASSAHPGAFNTTPVDVMKANFLGTLNLLEYAARYEDTRFMFVSSSEVYGENEENVEQFSEDMSGTVDYTQFRSCYPESKRASETLCASFKKQYGSDVVVVRPAYIYGRNILGDNTRADVYFLRQVLNHEDIVMYSYGTQVRAYCYIKDCISGMLYALLQGESGEVYNIGNRNCAVTLREYAQALADQAGVRLRFDIGNVDPNLVLQKTPRCVLATDKLEKLGWQARYSLDAGVKDMLKPEE